MKSFQNEWFNQIFLLEFTVINSMQLFIVVRKGCAWGGETSAITFSHIQYIRSKLLLQPSVLGIEDKTRNK